MRPSELAPAPSRPTLSAVYEAHFDYLCHTLRRLGVAPRNLEDVAHDVFLIVHRQLSTYDPTRPIRPWLFGIAYRVARDHKAKASVQREVHSELPERAASGPSQEEALDAERRRELATRALAGLSEDDRAVVILCDIDGASGPDAALVLGIPLNTVYSRLRVARQRLVERLQRLDPKGAKE